MANGKRGGKGPRNCGAQGERDARKLLLGRDWTDIEHRPKGERGSDFRATDSQGCRWSIEVKATASYEPKYWRQCCTNAKTDGLPPLLMWREKGQRTWLIKRNRDGRLRWETWHEGRAE